MPVLLHTGVWATIQRRMTQRTHRAAAAHKQSNGTRQRLRLLQRKKYRNCLILANNRLRLLPALQKNLDGGRNQRRARGGLRKDTEAALSRLAYRLGPKDGRKTQICTHR